MGIKLICISDTHGYHNDVQVPDGDILIHAGDFCRFGKISEVLDFKDWLFSQPHPHKILIGGNHDWRHRQHYKKMFHDVIYLENESVNIEGVNFYGSPETPIVAYEKPWVYNRGSSYVTELWERIPDDTDILITHGAPYNCLDKTWDGRNVGCRDLLARIKQVKPQQHIFGHIHESYGTIDQRYGIKFINCSQLDDNYMIANKPIVTYI